jgi:hypothetical protein
VMFRPFVLCAGGAMAGVAHRRERTGRSVHSDLGAAGTIGPSSGEDARA